MEETLSLLEKTGMKPPLCKPDKPIVIGRDKDGNVATYEFLNRYEYVWEPEDES